MRMRGGLLAAAVSVAIVASAVVTLTQRSSIPWAPAQYWWSVFGASLLAALLLLLMVAALLRRGTVGRFLFVSAVLVVIASFALPMNLRRPQSVIWVVCDTLRADYLSLYAHPVETSPFLDAWADELLVFDAAYAQASHTLVTAPGILASLYPSTHGLEDYGDVLDEGAVLVSEVLREAGFETFGAVSNPHVSARNGFAQGYQQYTFTEKWDELSSGRLNEAFFEWREELDDGQAYFALLWYIDPHSPFQWDSAAAEWAGLGSEKSFEYSPKNQEQVPLPEEKRATELRYEASIRTVDNSLRALVAGLKENGDYEDAVILFTSDHGESMWEHGQFGHGYHLYEDLTRVPLVMRLPPPLYFPPWSPRFDRILVRVTSVDLLPSLLEYLGLEADATHQGRSFLGRLDDRGGEAYHELKMIRYGPFEIFALRDGRWKYILEQRVKSQHSPSELLFDLDADPGELHNVIDREPEVARTLGRRLLELREGFEAQALPVGNTQVSDAAKARLKKLGYLVDSNEGAGVDEWRETFSEVDRQKRDE